MPSKSSAVPVYGLDKELADKQEAKYDQKQEDEARQWIEAVLGEKLSGDFLDVLKDGQVLLRLLNAIVPGACPKINKSAMPFTQMENISTFLDTSARLLSIPKHESFQTVDLYERKNKGAVLLAIYSLARHGQKFRADSGKPQLPALGPKLSDKHDVNFSAEKLNAGQSLPSQQSGYHASQSAVQKGATQAGINFGLGRQIVNQKSTDELSGKK